MPQPIDITSDNTPITQAQADAARAGPIGKKGGCGGQCGGKCGTPGHAAMTPEQARQRRRARYFLLAAALLILLGYGFGKWAERLDTTQPPAVTAD